MLVLVHELVGEPDVIEGKDAAQAGVDCALANETVSFGCFLVVGEVAALEALLSRPEVAQVKVTVVASRTSADDDHPAPVADEHRCRYRVLAGVLEDDSRRNALAQDVPDRFLEGAKTERRLHERGLVMPVRQAA